MDIFKAMHKELLLSAQQCNAELKEHSLACDALRQQGVELLPSGVTHREETYSAKITQLHCIARSISRNRDPLFTYVKSTDGFTVISPTKFCKEAKRVLAADWDTALLQYAQHRLSPVMRLFSRMMRFVHIYELAQIAPAAVDKLSPRTVYSNHHAQIIEKRVSRIVSFIRRLLGSKKMKACTDNFCRSARDNYSALLTRLDLLATQYRHVDSLRIDLHWDHQPKRPLLPAQRPNADTLEAFMRARVDFQRYIQRRFGSDLLAASWCLEYGRWSHYHVHYWIILKPQSENDSAALVESLGARWREISGGERAFYNCNAKSSFYQFKAVGRIDLHDATAVIGMRKIATYFTAAGLFMHLRLAKSYRTFGMSRVEKGKRLPRGRSEDSKPCLKIRIPLYAARERHFRNF